MWWCLASVCTPRTPGCRRAEKPLHHWHILHAPVSGHANTLSEQDSTLTLTLISEQVGSQNAIVNWEPWHTRGSDRINDAQGTGVGYRMELDTLSSGVPFQFLLGPLSTSHDFKTSDSELKWRTSTHTDVLLYRLKRKISGAVSEGPLPGRSLQGGRFRGRSLSSPS